MRNERATQNRVIALLRDQLGYRYLGNLEDHENSNIREENLRPWLEQQGKYTNAVIGKALFEFRKAAAISPNEDLYPVNRSVYSCLRYGVKVKDETTGLVQTVWLI